MIVKGCPQRHYFDFPYVGDDVVAIFITYQQNGMTKLEKELDDCTFEDGKVHVNLTQEDTLKFEDDEIVRMQIRVRLKDGFATKSDVVETYTDNILKGGVI